eukprot:765120-Hanusia_phi.AAC.1
MATTDISTHPRFSQCFHPPLLLYLDTVERSKRKWGTNEDEDEDEDEDVRGEQEEGNDEYGDAKDKVTERYQVNGEGDRERKVHGRGRGKSESELGFPRGFGLALN